MPFQIWHRYPAESRDAVFVDVDYPQLIQRKRDRMLHDDLLRDALLKTNLRSCQSPVFVRSDKYLALGCDLRDLTTLESVLKNGLEPDHSILFVAEVSITYMPVGVANALIAWANTLQDGNETN